MQFSRKSPRLDRRTLLAGLLSLSAGAPLSPAQADDFQAFVQALWPQAEAAGVSRETFERATADLTPDPGVVVKPKVQSEFTVSIPTYVGAAVTKARVEQGRALAKELAPVLRDVEKRYGVPGEVPLAVLAIESNFGAGTGGSDVLRVLATLAWKGHLTEKLKEEFVAALLMLQDGFPRSKLRGSWAGAMGMPQFLPSTYRKFAVRYAGDGTPDIWGSRQDAIASIASFLAGSGWVSGLSWGYETLVPETFDFANFDMDFAKFRSLGFTRPAGAALPASGAASLYLPTGAAGSGVFAHRQLGGRASIQYFGRLCAGGGRVGRPHRRPRHALKALAEGHAARHGGYRQNAAGAGAEGLLPRRAGRKAWPRHAQRHPRLAAQRGRLAGGRICDARGAGEASRRTMRATAIASARLRA